MLTDQERRDGWVTLVDRHYPVAPPARLWPRHRGHPWMPDGEEKRHPTQGWNQTLVTQRTAGTLFNTFTGAKTIINQQDLYGFYANYFQLGSKLRVTAHMAISNVVTAAPTMTFQVMLGSLAVFTTGAVQLNTVAHTLLPAKLVVDLTCQLTNTGVGGAIAKLMGQAVLTGPMFARTTAQVDDVQSDTILNLPTTSPALGIAFDSTISQILDFWVAFSASSASNGVQIAQYEVEALNMPAS
jgi:hypothetical protein